MNLDSPEDNWTPDERVFIRLNVLIIYKKVENPIDKFIIIAMHESGYTQEEIGQMLGISQEAVSKRYKNAVIRLKEFRKKGIV